MTRDYLSCTPQPARNFPQYLLPLSRLAVQQPQDVAFSLVLKYTKLTPTSGLGTPSAASLTPPFAVTRFIFPQNWVPAKLVLCIDFCLSCPPTKCAPQGWNRVSPAL